MSLIRCDGPLCNEGGIASACSIHAQFLVTGQSQNFAIVRIAFGGAYYFRSKSALGWLANKGERWMPRLEKAMKDVA